MSTREEIFAAANSLPASDRLALADDLWESVPPETWAAPDESELMEVQRRSAEYDQGGIQAISKDEVLRRIRERLNLNG